MLKKYQAKSHVSLSVPLESGHSAHVSFSPVTGGGSVFYTDSASLQWGLEHHPKFGRLFRLEQSVDDGQSGQDVLAVEDVSDGQSGQDILAVEDVSDGPAVNTDVLSVEVSCNDDAKDYLAERFGVSRSKLRNRAEIEGVALSHGVMFVWK